MESTLGWRFDFWLVVILAGTVTILAFFTMPETVRRTVSSSCPRSFHRVCTSVTPMARKGFAG